MRESQVERAVRAHLQNKGWNIELDGKKKGEHGCDIIALHPKWRKRIFIEAKGDSSNEKYLNQHRHNNFPVIIGQIISRMDKEGNRPNKARIYSIAVPKTWETMIANKAKEMKFSWKWMRLRIFLVDSEANVEEHTHTYFLK